MSFHDRQGTIATSAMIKNLIAYSAIGVITFIMGYTAHNQYFAGKTPRQPIEFSHRIHAGDNSIPCLYCHIYAERSRVAGIPNVKSAWVAIQSLKPIRPKYKNSRLIGIKKNPWRG